MSDTQPDVAQVLADVRDRWEGAKIDNNLVANWLLSDVRRLVACVESLQQDVQHLLDTCVPVAELREAEAEVAALRQELDDLRRLQKSQTERV